MKDVIDIWVFARTELIELLNSLSDEQLQFKPEGERWQPLYYQFACCLRTQLVFIRSLNEGVMDFAWYGDENLPNKNELSSKTKLLEQIEMNKEQMVHALESSQDLIEWPDSTMTKNAHISALTAHERMHIGQIISYFELANFELPKTFKENWSL